MIDLNPHSDLCYGAQGLAPLSSAVVDGVCAGCGPVFFAALICDQPVHFAFMPGWWRGVR